MTKKRELIIKRFSDGHIESRMDVTGKSENAIDRIMRGALINMNTDEWCIYDTDWDAAALNGDDTPPDDEAA